MMHDADNNIDETVITQETRKGILSKITYITRYWTLREWSAVGLGLQILVAIGIEGARLLLPEPQRSDEPFALTAQLDFIEFQEIQKEKPAEVQDLSDKIIEKDKLSEEKPINWENASDPTMDPNQRYMAKLMVNISPDDYPSRARRAEIGRVTVAVSLYISSAGKIRDVRIRSIRSAGDAAKPFTDDFQAAVRKILLQKTKLLNAPYKGEAGSNDFIWDTTVTFTLQ